MWLLKALFGGKNRSAPPASSSAAEPKARPAKANARRGSVVTNLKTFPSNMVGESNYQDALAKVAGGYQRDSQAFEIPAVIALDPANSYDPNAVKVEIKGVTVGYLPAAEAKRIGEMMRQQGIEEADLKAQIRGGWRTNQHDQGNFGVKLRLPRRGWVDFGVGAKEQ
ncbi:HIRAN domain-containing protein [Paracoccus spongiarum]|uniref:HIRAN domain-containing protein n=1 Tax=Paracoccus spongiarum TaxID=3064387 RepID=A0ABT9JDX9_9RHOB|nr:HIRAN domain-containing protein [Paracoccus sp. 2205BS29-5]MDP5307894.1 hypothetical protein [Paracoccus sp. 2205BS29-5]